MREISVEKVTEAVKKMCIEANYYPAPDVKCDMDKACVEAEPAHDLDHGTVILSALTASVNESGNSVVISSSAVIHVVMDPVKSTCCLFCCSP